MNAAYLAAKIPPFVAQPRWGGGVHEAHLREAFRCDHPTLRIALMIAYKRRAIDLCRRYVVTPVPAASRKSAA